jgi:hypothetical protein
MFYFLPFLRFKVVNWPLRLYQLLRKMVEKHILKLILMKTILCKSGYRRRDQFTTLHGKNA